MKKITILISVILMVVADPAFSQVNTKQPGNDIKPALLVIDIQNVYLQSIPERDKELSLYFINAFIDLFRKNGYPVIRVYHLNKDYAAPGSELFEFPSSVSIKPDDPKVIKTYPDGFNKTDLDKVIKETGSNTLFLCGLSAVGCVLATWIGAQDNDYQAFLLKDAIMSHKTEYTNNIETMFDAVSYDVVKLIVESSKK